MIFQFKGGLLLEVEPGKNVKGIRWNNRRPESVILNDNDLSKILRGPDYQVLHYLNRLRSALQVPYSVDENGNSLIQRQLRQQRIEDANNWFKPTKIICKPNQLEDCKKILGLEEDK